VVGVELEEALAARANRHLAQLEINNAGVLVGGPEAVIGERFDAIIVEGALDSEPAELLALLAPGGRLVVPILRRGVAVIHVYVRNADTVMFTSEFDATMPRLWSGAARDEFVF
jgi:protein-L-isoaspartate(D-aspartate) O-methyltransferase